MTGSEAKARFRGCYVATLTPFGAGGELDESVTRAHAAWLVENGVADLWTDRGFIPGDLWISEMPVQGVAGDATIFTSAIRLAWRLGHADQLGAVLDLWRKG